MDEETYLATDFWVQAFQDGLEPSLMETFPLILEGLVFVEDVKTAFLINKTYDFLKDYLMQQPEYWEKRSNDYWSYKLKDYLTWLEHLPKNWQAIFARRMSAELERAREQGELGERPILELDWSGLMSAFHQLPEYMKHSSTAVADIVRAQEKMYKDFRHPILSRLRIVLKGLKKAYNNEEVINFPFLYSIFVELRDLYESLLYNELLNPPLPKIADGPLISVIVPVYNAAKYLPEMLDSLQAQTASDFEAIFVDDGSTDRSVELIEKRKDPRFQVVKQPNAGAGAARNTGMDLAIGRYLSFLDADDIFEPTMLELAAVVAERHRADYVVYRADRYDGRKNRLTGQKKFREIPWSLRTEAIPPYLPFTYRQMTKNVFSVFVGWPWDKLFRRSFIMENEIRFQELRASNDLLFVHSALLLAKRIAIVDEVLIHQRRNAPGSISRNRAKAWADHYHALIALRDRMQEEGIYEELERDFVNYAARLILLHLNTISNPERACLVKNLHDSWLEELTISQRPIEYFYRAEYYRRLWRYFNRDKTPAPPSDLD